MKKMTKTLVLISAAAVFALSGCGRDRVPAGVMDEDQMVEFLSEAYLLESFYAVETDFNYSRMSGSIAASYDSLLAVNGITLADFERSIDYYSRHADKYEKIHKKVVKRLDEEVDAIK